mmetsp:Transcript_130593/g.227042  ORF Transcript_130593/g.227042 Transcript_130593/m.227042 type:complete len:208 (-) Transcript_130593:669-1292(-)
MTSDISVPSHSFDKSSDTIGGNESEVLPPPILASTPTFLICSILTMNWLSLSFFLLFFAGSAPMPTAVATAPISPSTAPAADFASDPTALAASFAFAPTAPAAAFASFAASPTAAAASAPAVPVKAAASAPMSATAAEASSALALALLPRINSLTSSTLDLPASKCRFSKIRCTPSKTSSSIMTLDPKLQTKRLTLTSTMTFFAWNK